MSQAVASAVLRQTEPLIEGHRPSAADMGMMHEDRTQDVGESPSLIFRSIHSSNGKASLSAALKPEEDTQEHRLGLQNLAETLGELDEESDKTESSLINAQGEKAQGRHKALTGCEASRHPASAETT